MPTQLGPLEVSFFSHPSLEDGNMHFPKRHFYYFLEYRTMGKVQKPSNSECYMPSSEPFRIYIYRVFRAQADWILILPSPTSCETAASLADKNACVWLLLLVHIVYFFR
jgi:hypothetical protein